MPLLLRCVITSYSIHYTKLYDYPHHVLRENKQATGAGADRVSQGMRLAFGKAVGTAARVIPGQKIYTCYANPQNIEKVKDALRHGGHKLPSPTHSYNFV